MKTVLAWGFGLLVAAVVGYFGWTYFRPAQADPTEGGRVLFRALAWKDPASESAAPVQADTVQTEPSETERAQWKAEMIADCADGNASVQIAHFDINEDGKADTICLRNFKAAPYGEFVEVAAQVARRGKMQRAYILLPVDAGVQDAVCMAEKGFTIEETHWTHEDLTNVFDDPARGRSVAIEVAGSDCDPPWLFWPKDANGEEVQFIFARM